MRVESIRIVWGRGRRPISTSEHSKEALAMLDEGVAIMAVAEVEFA